MNKFKKASYNWVGFREEFFKCVGDEYKDCEV